MRSIANAVALRWSAAFRPAESAFRRRAQACTGARPESVARDQGMHVCNGFAMHAP